MSGLTDCYTLIATATAYFLVSAIRSSSGTSSEQYPKNRPTETCTDTIQVL